MSTNCVDSFLKLPCSASCYEAHKALIMRHLRDCSQPPDHFKTRQKP